MHLKSKAVAQWDDAQDYLAAVPKRRASSRNSHVVVEFRNTPQPEQIAELELRGARVLGYVPDNALLVAASDETRFEGLNLRWAGRLRQADKLSRLLDTHEFGSRTSTEVLVEFFPDVDPQEAQALIREHLLETREHAGLRPNEFLVVGNAERVRRLAEWDEVSYIYPASQELIEGEAVEGCAGAVTDYGTVGQYIARVGEGWDGPGRNSAELRHFFSQLTSRLPAAEARAEVLRALGEWSRHAALNFTAGDDAAAPRTLNFLFAAGSHGDPFAFDGRSRVLAHAFYPAPPNPEPLAGDVHFDDDEPWTTGSNLDLYSVALHEIGHALGLGHSDRPGTVMYPYYRKVTVLTADDAAAIQDLYAAREEAPAAAPKAPETPKPSAPAPAPATPSAPKPAQPASPKPEQPAKPAETPKPKDTTAPTLAITSPATTSVLSSSAKIVVRGTARDNVGVTEVTWSTNAGASGVAQGTANWVTTEIPLNQGTNTITIRARDAAGNQSWRAVVVTRR